MINSGKGTDDKKRPGNLPGLLILMPPRRKYMTPQ
jgi:hypothetical protein